MLQEFCEIMAGILKTSVCPQAHRDAQVTEEALEVADSVSRLSVAAAGDYNRSAG